MSDYHNFLDKLTAKTRNGKVQWRPTAESDAFAVSLEGEFTVSVAKTGNSLFICEMRDQRGNKLLDLSAERTHAWEQGYEEAVETFERLSQLFEAARVSALDVRNQLRRAESLLDKY